MSSHELSSSAGFTQRKRSKQERLRRLENDAVRKFRLAVSMDEKKNLNYSNGSLCDSDGSLNDINLSLSIPEVVPVYIPMKLLSLCFQDSSMELAKCVSRSLK